MLPTGVKARLLSQTALHQQIRKQELQTNYAVECRLANQLVRGEEIRRRLSLLHFWLDQDWQDLWQACRWADRIDLCEHRLARDREEIRLLWQALWQRVAEAMLGGERISPLDKFFFLARPYLEGVLAGEITYAELDARYDWDGEGFKPGFGEDRKSVV